MPRRALALLLVLGCARESAPPQLASADVRLQRSSAPVFLHSVFRQLDTVLTAGQRDTLSRLVPESTAIYHFSVGLYIRNEMGLWRAGPLAESLSIRGVKHPDDMSGIILATYAQYLRGDSVDVGRAIAAQPKPPAGFKVLSAPIRDP